MMPHADQDDHLIRNDLSGEAGQSSFACVSCRRQKIKCDRALKTCGNCTKAGRICTYPLTVQKPGPKAGTHRRPKTSVTHRVTIDGEQNNAALKKIKLHGLSPGSPVNHGARNSSISLLRDESMDHRDSAAISSPSSSSKTNAKASNPFLNLVHPDHEPTEVETTKDVLSSGLNGEFWRRFQDSCMSLNCTGFQGQELINVYFNTMTSFSLFHRPTFETKLREILPTKHLSAFLSAIFSWALRFKETTPAIRDVQTTTKIMLEQSCRLHQECIEECYDDDPPLHLLQSLSIITHQKLIQGVRGKTWRMIGDCVRIAYELRLHLIDVEAVNTQSDIAMNADSEDWTLAEEKRRIWWCLWELDVFTSTIRKLPLAIDERFNYVFLPSADEAWFGGKQARSCFLNPDADKRWKDIVASGNRSPQTWFILINSYMFDAYSITSFPEVWRQKIGFKTTNQSDLDDGNLISELRDFIGDCTRSAMTALPRELHWEDRFLSFKPPNQTNMVSSRMLDGARFQIHVMSQLGRLMMCLWQVTQAPTVIAGSTESIPNHADPAIASDSDRHTWERYINAANLTAQVIRNSSPQHYQFVNPLIANAIWVSAASLVVAKLFGPEDFDSELAQPNFEMMLTSLNKFESFWEIPSVLKQKLRNLEQTLQFLQRKSTVGDSAEAVTTSAVSNADNLNTTMPPQQPQMQTDYLQSSVPTYHPNTANAADKFNTLGEDDWMAQMMFDFNAVPSFGFGQADYVPPMMLEPTFDNAGTAQNDGFNFAELFMYPYQ